ncbi:hypothetical protein ON010_g10224 [Phytophthora cinnamomi]|nr:hypothetical protein ON010_g10224 [Phytophthora cinnamomi]
MTRASKANSSRQGALSPRQLTSVCVNDVFLGLDHDSCHHTLHHEDHRVESRRDVPRGRPSRVVACLQPLIQPTAPVSSSTTVHLIHSRLPSTELPGRPAPAPTATLRPRTRSTQKKHALVSHKRPRSSTFHLVAASTPHRKGGRRLVEDDDGHEREDHVDAGGDCGVEAHVRRLQQEHGGQQQGARQDLQDRRSQSVGIKTLVGTLPPASIDA